MTPWRSGVVLVVACGACLPIHETTSNIDIVQKSFDVDGPRSAPKQELEVDASSGALNLTLANVTTCERERKETVKRWRRTEKTTNGVVHGALYVTGLLGMGAGGGVIADNATHDLPADRTFQIGDSTEQGRNVGIGVAGFGTLLVISAIASSVKAIDERTFVGMVDRDVPNSRKRMECERTVGAAIPLGIVYATGTAPVYLPLGTTDVRGRISTPWAKIVAELPASATGDGQLVAGSAESITATLAHGGDLVALATVATPKLEPDVVWEATAKLDTADGYRSYQQRFAQSPHAGEAETRAKTLTARDALRDFDAAIAAGKLDVATKQMEVLRTNAEPAVATAAQERLDKLLTTVRVKDARERLPKLIAGFEAAADPETSFADIKTALDQLRPVDADLVARAEQELAPLRERVTTRLVREGKDATAARDFATATKRFAAARATAVDPAAIDKTRTAAFDGAVRTGQAAARDLAGKQHYAEAIALLEQLATIAPQNASLQSDKARFVAARERALREEAERQAQIEAAEKARLEREERKRKEQADRDAAQQAAREKREAQERERREQAEREKAERAEKARVEREQQAARVEAERAQKARAEAERKQREETAKREAEEKRLAAAQEKTRQQAVERAKAEEAQRQKEEARRKEAAAKLEAQVAKAQAAMSPTVQFAIPARHNKVDVMTKLPVPSGCRIQTLAFFAKPALCKANCAPRAVSRATLSCGALTFVFVRDQDSVWLTCEGEKSSCSDCVAAGRSALNVLIDTKESLGIVQSCRK